MKTAQYFLDRKRMCCYMNFFNKKTVLFLLVFGQNVDIFSNVSEFFTVFSMYLKKPAEVGEIAPMSHAVSKELVKHICALRAQDVHVARYYLEAGGGCGAVSLYIAQKLRLCDRLDVVEINSEMCCILREKLGAYPNVFVHCCSILDWHPDYQYDAIISTLPFLSLGISFAQSTMKHFQKLATKNCIVSCVEYPIAVAFRKIVHGLRIKDANFIAVQEYMSLVRQEYLKEAAIVYYNVPPINVYHLSFGE